GLYFFEVPIELTKTEFYKVVDTCCKVHAWRIVKSEGNYQEAIHYNNMAYGGQLIYMKNEGHRILIASIDKPEFRSWHFHFRHKNNIQAFTEVAHLVRQGLDTEQLTDFYKAKEKKKRRPIVFIGKFLFRLVGYGMPAFLLGLGLSALSVDWLFASVFFVLGLFFGYAFYKYDTHEGDKD
ncbi:MAG: hypothetical protein AAFO94_11295, partial [Bacteroidota bacterium]